MSDPNRPEFEYDVIKQLLEGRLRQGSAERPRADQVRYIAAQLGLNEDVIERLVADLAGTESAPVQKESVPLNRGESPEVAEKQQAVPFLLVRLQDDLRPGLHVLPEFHVIFAGWDGHVRVKATIHGTLDKGQWNEEPTLFRETDGYSIFHQSLLLTYNGSHCPPGEYRLVFDCHFHNSRSLLDSHWHGWFHFSVHDQQGHSGPVLEVVSDGQSMVNLCGLNLKQFSKLRVESSDNAVFNLQSFLQEFETEAAKSSENSTSQAKMIPVSLRPKEVGWKRPPKPPIQAGRFELPGGRRLLLLAQDRLMLGRNRPDPHAANANDITDLALRMYPRSETLDSITQCISKQHLCISTSDNKITLEDPRRSDMREAYVASVNNSPLLAPVSIRHSDRPIKYVTRFGTTRQSDQPPRQIGLELHSYFEFDMSRELLPQLKFLTRDKPDHQRWLRDAANLDAVLIERAGNPDELDGKEAYLMVLGVVFIGSEPRCPIRLTDPSVDGLHAALCHWDGQFHVFPTSDGEVRCEGRRISPGQFGTVYLGETLKIGNVEMTLQKPMQYGL